jgi:hypothetical protein
MCTSKASKVSTGGETEVAGGEEIDAHVAHKLPRSPHVTAACSVSIRTLVPVKQGKKMYYINALSPPLSLILYIYIHLKKKKR